MRFRDSVLLRLINPATRDGLIDSTVAESLARAAYEADLLPLDPPFAARADRIEPGVALSVPAHGEAQVVWPGQAAPVTARIDFGGVVSDPLILDALWEGSITATASAGAARIERISGGLTDTDGRLALHFAPLDAIDAAPMSLAVVAALLIDDPDDPARDLAAIFARVRRVRSALALMGRTIPAKAARRELPVVLILPEDRLDDAVWPGAGLGDTQAQARSARLASANGWATSMGVVIATSARPA